MQHSLLLRRGRRLQQLGEIGMRNQRGFAAFGSYYGCAGASWAYNGLKELKARHGFKTAYAENISLAQMDQVCEATRMTVSI